MSIVPLILLAAIAGLGLGVVIATRKSLKEGIEANAHMKEERQRILAEMAKRSEIRK